MAHVTDIQRGLVPGRSELAGPGTRAGSPGGLSGQGVKAATLHEAAVKLGQVYRLLRRPDQTLGEWALTTYRNAMGERVLSPQLDLPTKELFGPEVPITARIQAIRPLLRHRRSRAAAQRPSAGP